MQPSSGVKLRSSHRVRGLVLALALATLGVAACGDDDEDESEAATTAAADSDISTAAGQAGEEIVPRRQPADRLQPGPTPTPLTQSGPWHVVSGTGAFKGMQGDGEMEIRYEPHTEATEGRETFTGTVEP